MCDSKPKWSDPRQKDPKYLAVAGELGITNKKGKPVIRNQDQLYRVQTELDSRTLATNKAEMQAKEQAFQDSLAQQAAAQAAQRSDDIRRSENQFSIAQAQQQTQYEQSMAAQERALQTQLAAQAQLQRNAEEAALRSQVPAMTDSSSNARRVKASSSTKQQARRASMGTSQLRVPLGIGSGNAGTSPVKLNIGN